MQTLKLGHTHLLVHNAELFGRQVVEGEEEPPVEVALTP